MNIYTRRTDWGYFDKSGKPLAVGDAHWKWECPQREWEHGGTYTHPITGEVERVDPYPLNCPMDNIDYPARIDRCKRCGVEFRYP